VTELPEPLTPADCDLRDFAFMPLDVVRLRDSDLSVTADADEFRCAVLLWCASWHQVPAASLPDDDKALAQYAGYGRVVKEWQKVREGALRGWVKCTDSRLYHAVVAEKANDAWVAKLKQRLKTECARIKKHNERHGTRIPSPDFDSWMCAGCPVGQALPVPSDNVDLSQGQAVGVAGEKHSKGQGEGQGEGSLRDATTPSRSVQIAVLLRAMNIPATTSHPLVCMTWADDPAVTDEVLKLAVATAVNAKPGERIPVNYLENIVRRLAHPPAGKGQDPAAPPKKDWL
jgi:hypothetical protein